MAVKVGTLISVGCPCSSCPTEEPVCSFGLPPSEGRGLAAVEAAGLQRGPLQWTRQAVVWGLKALQFERAVGEVAG